MFIDVLKLMFAHHSSFIIELRVPECRKSNQIKSLGCSVGSSDSIRFEIGIEGRSKGPSYQVRTMLNVNGILQIYNYIYI